ncbi:hypothetical protein HAX54_001820 [Datura stramonium]|uniref:Uncharacterized protein n=1 Tax=Datura stramonium TaxID=4076 RepID=A0ABS8T3L4_DATST|nr:hypothetical protein [Datura stramonium]
MHTNECTTNMNIISYDCVLIEVDVAQALPLSIEINTPKGSLDQIIAYDWRPKFCPNYLKFGHEVTNYWKGSIEKPNDKGFQGAKRRRKRKPKVEPRKPKLQDAGGQAPVVFIVVYECNELHKRKILRQELIQLGSEADFLAPGISDRSPILLQLHQRGLSRPKPFKLFKIVLSHPNLGKLQGNIWNKRFHGTGMFQL